LLGGCKTLSHVKQVCALVSKIGFDADPLVAGKVILLAAITLAVGLDYAHRVFIPSPDVMYNTLLRRFSDSGHPHNSLSPSSTSCGGHLIPPGTFSFAFLLQAAANFKSLNAGTQLHALSIHHGLEADSFVGTTLVSMYAECGCVSSARKAFGEMPQPNVVAWNVVVTACFRLK